MMDGDQAREPVLGRDLGQPLGDRPRDGVCQRRQRRAPPIEVGPGIPLGPFEEADVTKCDARCPGEPAVSSAAPTGQEGFGQRRKAASERSACGSNGGGVGIDYSCLGAGMSLGTTGWNGGLMST